MSQSDASRTPRVGLLVTCLIDAIRPRIGFALAGDWTSGTCQAERCGT